MDENLKLDNQLCFPIYLCSKELIRKYTPFLKEINLTYTQYIVMMYFWEKRVSNLKDLGKVMLLDSSTLTPLVRKLVDKGYLKVSRNETDSRNLVIEITKNGDNIKKRAKDIPMEVAKCVNLDNEDSKNLYKLVYKVLKNIMEVNENERSK